MLTLVVYIKVVPVWRKKSDRVVGRSAGRQVGNFMIIRVENWLACVSGSGRQVGRNLIVEAVTS